MDENTNYTLYLSAGQCAGVSHNFEGRVPGAYVAQLVNCKSAHTFWGYGGVRDTTALFAYALIPALAEFVSQRDESTYPEKFRLQVIVANEGFFQRLEQTATYESGRSNSKGSPNEHLAWKEATTLFALSDAIRPCKPSNGIETQTLKACHMMRNNYAKVAHENNAADTQGLLKEGSSISTFGTGDETAS